MDKELDRRCFSQGLSLCVLDDYHGCEYLHAFSSSFFRNKDVEQKWTSQQKELLLESQVQEVIKKQTGKNKAAEKLIVCYQANKDRMHYQHYRQMGCDLIGSGAIGAAHTKRSNTKKNETISSEMEQAGSIKYAYP